MNLSRPAAAAFTAAVLLICGCSGPRRVIAVGPIPNDTTTAMSAPPRSSDLPAHLPDDSALILIRMLENDPLMADGPSLRSRLFAWVIASPSLAGFETATAPIDPLGTSAYPYREELLMQYIFAGAAWHMTVRDTSATIVDQQIAGVKSLLTAYKNLLLRDGSLHASLIDSLDDARRRGTLRACIQRKNLLDGKP
jgi:hypothetical protein